MIRPNRAVFVVLMSLAAFGMGCTENPVGRICDLGPETPQADEAVVATPSLDCVSRTCLRVRSSREPPPGSNVKNLTLNQGLCSNECTADSDCDRVPESPCLTGFTCGVAITAGPFCCQKFCICKDFVVIPEATGVLPSPLACDATVEANECCNLPGRAGNHDKYPNCK